MGGGRSALRLERFPSLKLLPRSCWDHVAAQYSVYGSYSWLSAVEGMPGALDTAYYLAFDDGDEPVAAFAAYLVDSSVSRSYHPASVVCGDAISAGHLFPAMLLGGRTGYTSELMVRARAHGEPPRFTDQFAAEIAALGSEWKASSRWLLYADSRSASLARPALGGEVWEVAPTTVIRLPAGGVQSWLSALHGHRRRRIQAEMRAFAEAGYRVEISPLTADDVPAFGDLLARLLRKYRGTASAAAMRSYVSLQAGSMSSASVAFRCYLGNKLVAFSYGFEWGGSLYMRACGFDYGHTGRAYEYFSLVYYYPVMEAYARGLHQVELGPASYDAKRLRGATMQARYAVGDRPAPAPSWAELNRRYLASIYGESPACPGG
jgi:uncharacterized protein